MTDQQINEATCVVCGKQSERLDHHGLCQWCAEDQARAKHEAILFPEWTK